MDLRSVLKRCKYGICVPPQLKDNGAFDGNTYFDTLGLNGILFLLVTGTMDAAVGSDNSTTAPKIEECNTTDGTYTAVSSAALAAVLAATDDNKLAGIFVDLSKTHKRYMKVDDPTAGDGTTGVNFAAIAIGFPADQMPNSATECGLKELIEA